MKRIKLAFRNSGLLQTVFQSKNESSSRLMCGSSSRRSSKQERAGSKVGQYLGEVRQRRQDGRGLDDLGPQWPFKEGEKAKCQGEGRENGARKQRGKQDVRARKIIAFTPSKYGIQACLPVRLPPTSYNNQSFPKFRRWLVMFFISAPLVN
jgi:hypothetical protein